MADLEESRWFALHVRSRHEKSVEAQLYAKDQEAFLPLYSVRSQWRDRSKEISLPLFPGYVFCRFEAAAKSTVLATSGVIDLVRAGQDPAPIDDCEIQAVQLIVNSRVQAKPHSFLVKGQQVMMIEGPLSGLTGTLVNVRNSLRLVVSVEMLCRSVLVEIDHDWVIARTPHSLTTGLPSKTAACS